MLIAIPWVLASNEAATLSYPSYDTASVSAPVTSLSSDAADPADSNPTRDGDHLSMVIHVPAGKWVDTGIDMCGCTQLRIEVVGAWQTPRGTVVDGSGAVVTGSDARRKVADRPLTTAAPYGSLIARVGSDPFTAVGTDRELDGDQFNDAGALEIGMNAGRNGSLDSARGDLTVFITGNGSSVHPASYCAPPRPGS